MMDYLSSFFQNIKDKLSSPFFATLFLIIILHHWQLWYTLFNFDDNCTLADKLITLDNLATNEFSWRKVCNDISWAIGLTLISYIILLSTRTLSMLIEFKAMPWITGKVVDKRVVLKTVHDEVVSERDEYSDKYEEQRKNVRLLSKNYDEQTEQIKEKDRELIDNNNKITKLNKNVQNFEHKLQQAEYDLRSSEIKLNEITMRMNNTQQSLDFNLSILKQYREIFFEDENREFWSSLYNFPPIVIEKVRELKNLNKWRTFISVGNFLEHGGSIGGEAMTEMEHLGLILERLTAEEFTALGEIIYKFKTILEDVR